MDRDAGLQRVYFDLSSQAVVEPEVGGIMIEMKQGHRAILRELLRGLELADPAQPELDGIAVYLVAGLEGLVARAARPRRQPGAAARARDLHRLGAVAAIERR